MIGETHFPNSSKVCERSQLYGFKNITIHSYNRETIAVEFKRCCNGIESDTYETVCSFLNRFDGDIFMGVLDNGTVVGIPKKAAPDMVKNFIVPLDEEYSFDFGRNG